MMKPMVMAMALAASGPALAAETAPFEPADLYRIAQVESPRLSPDGKRVLYTRASFDIGSDRRVGDLWLADIAPDGHLDRRLLAGGAAGARWSPDGSRVAYVAQTAGKPQIFVLRLADGTGRAVTTLKNPPSQLAWSPDGRQIAFAMRVDSPPFMFKNMPKKPEGASWAADAKVVTSFTYRTNDSGFLTPGTRQLFVADAATGVARQVTKGDRDQLEGESELAWTRDGKAIVLATSQRPDAELRARESDLIAVDVASGKSRAITDVEGSEAQPALSPDGRTVAYVGFEETPAFYAQPDLWTVPLAGGARRNLTKALDRPVSQAVWAEDGRSLIALYSDAGVQRVARVFLDGRVERLAAPVVGGTRLYLPSSGGGFDAANGTMAFTTLRADGPAGLGIARGGRVIADYDPNAEWRAGKRLGPIEEVHAKSRADGRDIQGWIVLPPGFDSAKRYPLALEIHGGPNGDYGPMFSLTHQIYAAAGYVVLFTNPRGSIGYGRDFANFYGKPYPSQDHDDLMSVVDAVAARPYIDKRNLFIGGGSGGGVLTLWAIGQEPDKFRAAAALRPVTDWTVQALSSDLQALTGRYWLAGGTPWDDQPRFWAQSPLSLVGKVKTPTVLITGEADYRTPIAQTEAYYQALKLRGVPAEMVRLPEANHGMGRPSQWLTSNLAVVDWYERYRVR